MFIKEFVKKILYGNRYSSETYIKYLKGLGVKIGERTVIFSPRETFMMNNILGWLKLVMMFK